MNGKKALANLLMEDRASSQMSIVSEPELSFGVGVFF